MTFTAVPEEARQAALAEGTATLQAIIADYAVAGGGPPPIARLNAARNGIETAAGVTIADVWTTHGNPGLVNLWASVVTASIYIIGGATYDVEQHPAGPERDRALDIQHLATDHAAALAAAVGATQALQARTSAHPEDPIDPGGRGGGP